jgi:hypothetical protein
MNHCVACSTDHEAGPCPACGFAPEEIDGFPAYALELAHEGGGYDPSLFAEIAPQEAENFWFLSRNELIVHSLREFAPPLNSSPSWRSAVARDSSCPQSRGSTPTSP